VLISKSVFKVPLPPVAAAHPPTHLLLQTWVIREMLRPLLHWQYADEIFMIAFAADFQQPVVVSGFWPARAKWCNHNTRRR
jgi:hypothetical protein